jgi:hypothetical protein
MGCTVVNVNGIRAIVCGRDRRKRCKACGQMGAEYQCDWKVPHRRSGTCDAWLCVRCRTQPAPDKDLCPDHATAWRAWKQSRGLNDGDESKASK